MSNNNKHSGELIADVVVQMRFIPLKTETDEKENDLTATISVKVDDKRLGTPNNLLKLKKIKKLEGEGETFIQNKIKLMTTMYLIRFQN